jgi:hypothetical protein
MYPQNTVQSKYGHDMSQTIKAYPIPKFHIGGTSLPERIPQTSLLSMHQANVLRLSSSFTFENCMASSRFSSSI